MVGLIEVVIDGRDYYILRLTYRMNVKIGSKQRNEMRILSKSLYVKYINNKYWMLRMKRIVDKKVIVSPPDDGHLFFVLGKKIKIVCKLR